jgi:hypothetical protein
MSDVTLKNSANLASDRTSSSPFWSRVINRSFLASIRLGKLWAWVVCQSFSVALINLSFSLST